MEDWGSTRLLSFDVIMEAPERETFEHNNILDFSHSKWYIWVKEETIWYNL